MLEHGDTFEDSMRVVHHRSLGHLLRVVDEERFGADARAAVAGTVDSALALGAATLEGDGVAPRYV